MTVTTGAQSARVQVLTAGTSPGIRPVRVVVITAKISRGTQLVRELTSTVRASHGIRPARADVITAKISRGTQLVKELLSTARPSRGIPRARDKQDRHRLLRTRIAVHLNGVAAIRATAIVSEIVL